MNKSVFIFINIFLRKSKRLNDITGHNSLDINVMHLFILKFELYSVLLTTKIYFPLSHKKTKKVV